MKGAPPSSGADGQARVQLLRGSGQVGSILPTQWSDWDPAGPSQDLCWHASVLRESLPRLDPGHGVHNHPTAKRQGRHWDADSHEQLENICAEEPAARNFWLVLPLEDTTLKKGLLLLVSD